jgi:hypothetical protein
LKGKLITDPDAPIMQSPIVIHKNMVPRNAQRFMQQITGAHHNFCKACIVYRESYQDDTKELLSMIRKSMSWVKISAKFAG